MSSYSEIYVCMRLQNHRVSIYLETSTFFETSKLKRSLVQKEIITSELSTNNLRGS